MISEFEDDTFYCKQDQFISVSNSNGTSELYCPITTSQDVFDYYDVLPGIKWGAVGAVYGYYLLFLLVSILGLKYVNHLKR